ncbi:DUF6286 domain-containing protein [Galactobacter caseinivorans]|uniref:DUF6286 domain-containing protein n=1 Tax=Galactobacter caseinivorans TaxID=2676123 RepID=A0A496PHG6_9MICC|nr:DUF6286 domain-containing protein [Galactobacter caseinivorans]RKW69922.1 hypothetical protein DWQ67_10660 [Galactobacter caseinivorans]
MSKTSGRHPRHFFYRRPSRVVPNALVALVLLVAGGLVSWAAIARLSTGTWQEPVGSWVTALRSLRWQDTAVLWAAGALALIGVVLLLCVLVPGRRHNQLVTPALADGAEETLTLGALSAYVESALQQVDGVHQASARSRAGAVRASVRTPLRDRDALGKQATAAAQAAVDRLPLGRRTKVSVTVDVEGESA